MMLPQLQQQIVAGKLDNLYIFTGEEVAIMDIYLKKLQQVSQKERQRVDSVQKAYSKLTQRRMSGQLRCFIVTDDKDYLKQEKIWAAVQDACNNTKDMLIIIYNNLDKRSKFYKQYKDKIVVFEKLTPEILIKYVQKEIPLVDPIAKQLIEICECDYSRILLECDKIKHYYEAHKDELTTGYEGAFIRLKLDGVIYQPIGDITFKFTDAIAMRDYDLTAKYLLQAKAKNEPEIMVLSILYNTFKQILMVQGLGSDKSNAVARTGLTAWQVNMAKQKLGYYTLPELLNALKTIRFVEKSIKTGQIEANVALEYLIVNIM